MTVRGAKALRPQIGLKLPHLRADNPLRLPL